MKTKMLYICTISMMLSVLCGCGTEGPGAYVHLSVLSVKNSSTHDIEIIVEKPSSVLMTGTFTIKSGATFKTMKDAEGGYYNPNPLVAQIKFDDGTTITHREEDGDTYHNFCSEAAFEKRCREKGAQNIHSYLLTRTTNMQKSMQIKPNRKEPSGFPVAKTFADVKPLLLDYAAKNTYAAQLYNLNFEK